MRLREILDVCTDENLHQWLDVPGSRPATSMVAGFYDPGAEQPQMRPLTGHHLIVYEPDPRVAVTWLLPDDDRDAVAVGVERYLPDWLEGDSTAWKSATPGWAVVLLAGAPVWQTPIWYLNWGSGVGGFVHDFRSAPHTRPLGDTSKPDEWLVTVWQAAFARLIDSFEGSGGLGSHDPTLRICPRPIAVHPTEQASYGWI